MRGTVKAQAKLLRQVADTLDIAAAVTGSVDPRKVIKENSPPDTQLCVNVSVPLDLVGHRNFNIVDLMTRDAGSQLGAAIAARLEFEWRAGMVRGIAQRDPYARHEVYTAKVCVFTPYQLEQLVEAAIKAGQSV